MRTTRLPVFTSFTKSSHVMQRCLALIHTNQSILHFSFLPVSLLQTKPCIFMGHQPFVTSQRSSISPSRCLRSVCNCLALIPSTHVEGAGNQCREAVNKGLIMPFLHCFLLSIIGTQDGTERYGILWDGSGLCIGSDQNVRE